MKKSTTKILSDILYVIVGVIVALVFWGFVNSAKAQAITVSRYPVYENIPEHVHCRDVVVSRGASPAGAVVGGVIGYALGRELDRGYHHHGYVVPVPHRGYVPHRGHYYRDGYYVHGNSHAGRVSGAVVGATVGAYTGRGETIRRVCDESRMTRSYLTGYRVVERHPNGRTFEYFEPVR